MDNVHYIIEDINTYDIETYQDPYNNTVPYCISLILYNKTKSFYFEKDVDIVISSLSYITKECQSLEIEFFIHNLNFDGFILIDSLTRNAIEFKIFSVKTNLYWIKINYCSIQILFRCSFKILPWSLDKIGLMEGYKKFNYPYAFVNKDTLFYIGKTPSIEFWKSNDFENKDVWNLKEETIKYCERDVLILKKMLTSLSKLMTDEYANILLQNFSTPSIAHTLFFKKYNFLKIEKNLKIIFSNYIRQAYFGGRCEVFGNCYENEHIKYYDFSGMYGQCMEEEFHLGKPVFEVPKKIVEPGFYTVTYNSENFKYPILPIKNENRLMFVNGINTATFWFEEILLFQNYGGKIIEIKHALIYKNKGYPFKDFVQKFKSIREKGGYYNIFGKLMINSLYGSMALSDKEIYTYITQSEIEFKDVLTNYNIKNFYKINKFYVVLIEMDSKFRKKFKIEKENAKRNVSYACAISSKARIKLYNLFNMVEKDNGRLLYCDTDSVFAAYSKLDNRENIKNIKWIKFYKKGVFALPKSYALLDYDEKEEIKLKGFSNNTLKFNKFEELFFKNSNFIFKNQLFFDRKNFKIEIKENEKKLNFAVYKKRIFSYDKKDSEALIINENITL